jgi:hypothetical protein
MFCPFFADEVVHPHRGCLVDCDEHRLAEEPATDEVADQIGGDASQTLEACDELVLGAETPRQRAFLLLVEICLLEDRRELVVEALVDDLQLWDAVLVIQRDGRAVFDRVALTPSAWWFCASTLISPPGRSR